MEKVSSNKPNNDGSNEAQKGSDEDMMADIATEYFGMSTLKHSDATKEERSTTEQINSSIILSSKFDHKNKFELGKTTQA